ncbi:MAG: hypothetical protein ACRDHY_11485, partial [Anaerolineales bacterium]
MASFERRIRRTKFCLAWGMLAALVAGGCNFGFGPRPTPTLTADEVIATAQAMAELTRQAGPPSPTPQPATATATPPLESQTPSPTATGPSPVVTANYTANVRSGPSEIYPVIDFMLQGETAAAVGRYDDVTSGRWWMIERLGAGLNGWVWGGAVSFSG